MNIRGDFLFFCDYPILQSEKELPLYLLNMGQQHCQDHIIRPEGYPDPQILYCTKGSGTLIIDGKKIPVPAHTAVFLPAAYPHEYYAEEEIWDIHWVVPAGAASGEILEHFGLTAPAAYPLSDEKNLEHIFRKMHEAIRSDSFFGNYRASGYLYDFLIEFYHVISSRGISLAPNSALMKAIDYINSNYAAQITLEDLCAVSGVSRQHLCLLFRNNLGTRPMEYIAKRRIQAAKELLRGSDRTIEDIAEETGFCSASYFCKLFRRYEGFSPSRFRKI